MATQTIGR